MKSDLGISVSTRRQSNAARRPTLDRRSGILPLLALAGITLIFIVLSSLIAYRTPAWESADEPSHVQNIETLVSGHWYGIDSRCGLGKAAVYCTGTEPQQAPLYYLLLAGWQKIVGVPAHAPFKGVVNGAYFFGKPSLYLNHSASDHHFLMWLRLPNVFFGALTILVTFAAVRLLTPDPWTPVVAASLVAFLPHFAFLSSFVTNDNLANLLGAVLVLASVRFLMKPSLWRIALVGAVFGLLVITKLSALPVGIVIIVLAAMAPSWSRRFAQLAVGGGATLALSLWYLVQNTVRYGSPLAGGASTRYLEKVGGLGTLDGKPYKVSDPFSLIFLQVPGRFLHSFWYQSDWNAFHWPLPVDIIFLVATLLALAGLIRYNVDTRVLVTLGVIVIAGLLAVWILAFQSATYEGKYAIVSISAMAGLVALGVERWRLPVRFLLPAVGLASILWAIQTDVISVRWP